MLRDRCRSVAKLRVIEAPRVQLTNGLKRTKEEPSSVPTLRPHYHAVEPLKIRPVSSMQGRRWPVETQQEGALRANQQSEHPGPPFHAQPLPDQHPDASRDGSVRDIAGYVQHEVYDPGQLLGNGDQPLAHGGAEPFVRSHWSNKFDHDRNECKWKFVLSKMNINKSWQQVVGLQRSLAALLDLMANDPQNENPYES